MSKKDFKKLMDWDAQFNEMPKEYRHIAAMSGINDQIRGLEREKLRLKRSYQRNVKEINQYIENLKSSQRREV